MESMMTARQVAELLGVHENWVYDQAASGELPSYKIGGTRRFDPDELRGWIEQRREPESRNQPRRHVARKVATAAGGRRRAQHGERQSKAGPSTSSPADDPQPRLFE
jgi:excisionase family DNA binding protein